MVFKQNFKYLKNEKINFIKVILKLECLLYQNIYIYIYIISSYFIFVEPFRLKQTPKKVKQKKKHTTLQPEFFCFYSLAPLPEIAPLELTAHGFGLAAKAERVEGVGGQRAEPPPQLRQTERHHLAIEQRRLVLREPPVLLARVDAHKRGQPLHGARPRPQLARPPQRLRAVAARQRPQVVHLAHLHENILKSIIETYTVSF